ncbi:TadE/TadG family type IV pilus assembly protein [Sphingobium subterraneum]|uniref:Flp pilus assembly protein TadG n=1 Tax=Sphingobium subterraneum TaxID=627688 RepID=A0A841IUW9_9SPHN|nr:TadE family protein [Sphingobium subterraneum]MBB6122473.1 Flp pilus assembly protein TadG [Sphingobium subterraneum]
MKKFWPALKQDEKGAAAVEFAVVSTAFLTLLMGGFDMGHTLYTQAVMQGIVQKAARNSSLETGTSAAKQDELDAEVRAAVKDLNKSLTDNDIQITRNYYHDFTTAAAKTPEDVGGDGVCSPGEKYFDRNFSGSYDSDGGANGQGGAKDAVVYSVSTTYPRLFPVATLVGASPNVTITATTLLANQPYGEQASGAIPQLDCP